VIRIIVTGSDGFIGSNFVKFISTLTPPPCTYCIGKEVDLTDSIACKESFKRFDAADYIFHFADLSGNLDWSLANSATQFLCNTKISVNVLESVCLFHPKARFVSFSSLWAYPKNSVIGKEFEYWDGPMRDGSKHYGITKKLLGIGIDACRRQYGLHGTSLVLGSVYGPGDRSDHVIPTLIRKMRADPNRLEVSGNGLQQRDFIFITDQVRAIYINKDFDGELLNIGSGVSSTLQKVVEILVRLLAYKGEIVFLDRDNSSIDKRVLDVSVATGFSGWPRDYNLLSLEFGLELTLQSEA
jgi:nucleoside-diphosphate-sugar epimerase